MITNTKVIKKHMQTCTQIQVIKNAKLIIA
jgi:hypothetical protein